MILVMSNTKTVQEHINDLEKIIKEIEQTNFGTEYDFLIQRICIAEVKEKYGN
jgi:hypothetical protein